MTDKNEINFQAEITQLMNIIINNFYSNKDVFLRELVSNASDALDKIRYLTLNDDNYKGSKDYFIRISMDKERKMLSIEDTGIGMSKDDMITNLGTIAKSGTKQFFESLKDNKKNIDLIGQFGMGFYSAYLVADKVIVTSKKENEPVSVWESDAKSSFTVYEPDDLSDNTRGTRLDLYLKDDMLDYLKESTIKDIVVKHSQFINYPIELYVEKSKEVEVEPENEAEPEPENDTKKDNRIEEVDEEEENKEPEPPKTKKVIYYEWEKVNKEKPLWIKNKDEISEDEYKSFYKSLSNDFEDYLSVKQFTIEGQINVKGIIFIPKRKPFDMFQGNNNKKSNMKLYVKRVLISDEIKELVPEWLSFIHGVIDCEDLPLNVSREMLQQNSVMKVIKKNVVKKCLEAISEIKDEEYNNFYENFSKNIKLGLHEDEKNRSKLTKMLRYNTYNNQEKIISLDEYVDNMEDDDKEIYYLTGENKTSIVESPFIEKIVKNKKDVIIMTDPLDEYIMQHIKEYEGKNLVSVAKESINLSSELSDDLSNLCEKIKDILGDKVEKVKVSNRIVDSPSCLVTTDFGWSANMERIMNAQALGANDMQAYMKSKKVMEINGEHKIIKELNRRVEIDSNDKTVKDLVELIFDISLLRSGFNVSDSKVFGNRLTRMIELGLSLNDDSDDESDAELDDNDVTVDDNDVTVDDNDVTVDDNDVTVEDVTEDDNDVTVEDDITVDDVTEDDVTVDDNDVTVDDDMENVD